MCQSAHLIMHGALYYGSQGDWVRLQSWMLRYALSSCFWAKPKDLLISCGISSLAAIQSELLHGSCPLPSSLSKLLDVYE